MENVTVKTTILDITVKKVNSISLLFSNNKYLYHIDIY